MIMTETRNPGSRALFRVLMFPSVLLVVLAAAESIHAQTLTTLHSFAGGSDGSYPSGELVRNSAGSLTGTTQTGGQNWGTAFRVTASGAETVLYSFGLAPDGQEPSYGALVHDKAGNLYGTTFQGGAGFGTVFKLSPKGKEEVLYTFKGGSDGVYPKGSLVIDSAGNLYGNTDEGGGTGCDGAGCGTVFKISPAGEETILHIFTGAPDGANPQSGLVKDAEGNLYGTTFSGGASNYGAVFRLTPAGEETVLYSFAGPPDGAYPFAGLYLAGDLFGTTAAGGKSTLCSPGCGTVFKLTKAGKESVLYGFSGLADGSQPFGGLTRDKEANLYGTSFGGGNPACNGGGGCGTIFKLTKENVFTTFYSFTGATDGANPYAGVILDPSGNLYGTTYFGGASDRGVVFELTP
jgi:uncharacterized repeat protein (TIGR03803 family)